jgi:chromosome segregation ATPase
MQFTHASIENLAAIVQEKDQKLIQITSEYEDLTKQFELHYDIIVERDATIQQMQVQLEASTNEWHASESRAKITTQMITRSSDRLTLLEKRNEELKKSIHDINGEILTIQFETEKLREVRPVVLCTVNPEELDALRTELADAERRRDMALELVAEIKNESEITIDSTHDHQDAEQREIESKIREFTGRRNELLSAIRGIERQTRERIEQIDSSRRDVEETLEVKSEIEIEVETIRVELREIELETAALETKAEEERKTEEQRRILLQTIKQKLDERNEITDTDLSRAETLLETQQHEISKLASILTALNGNVEKLSLEIEESESGMKRKPDIEQFLQSEKTKLDRLFRTKARKQLKAQQKLEIEQKATDAQIEKQRAANEQQAEVISRCIQETRKRCEFIRNERKKAKLIAGEKTEIQKEIEALKEKEREEEEQLHAFEPPPVIQTIPPPRRPPVASSPKKAKPGMEAEILLLEREMEKYDRVMENAKTDIGKLQEECDEITSSVAQLKKENAELAGVLKEFTPVKLYWEKLRASQLPGPKARKGGAKA